MNGKGNILKVYAQATALEIEQGMEWYTVASNEARSLCQSHAMACGVIAAVSPGLRWDVNILAARGLIEGAGINGLGRIWPANIYKAERIVRGHDPGVVLGGNKVRAFYQCLLNPLDWFHVVVDGHAYGIWSNERIPLNKIHITNRRYRLISSDYMRTADSLGILPNQLQAIVWLTWRRLHELNKLTIENYKV